MAQSNIDRNPRVTIAVASNLPEVVDSVKNQSYINKAVVIQSVEDNISKFYNDAIKLAIDTESKIIVFLNDENYFLTDDALQRAVDKFVKEEYNIAGMYTDIKDINNNLIQYLPSFNKEPFIVNRFAINNTLFVQLDCLKDFKFNEEVKHLQLVQLFKFMVHRFSLTHYAETLIAHTLQQKDISEDLKHI